MNAAAVPTTPSAGSAGHSDPGGLPVLTMVEPLLGFPEHRRFTLNRLDETGTMCDLRAVDEPELRFVVVPPTMFFPDYAPEVPDHVVQALGSDPAGDGADLMALVVLHLGRTPEEATANLLAPVLVNPGKRLAAQVVLDDPALSLRTPLASAVPSED